LSAALAVSARARATLRSLVRRIQIPGPDLCQVRVGPLIGISCCSIGRMVSSSRDPDPSTISARRGHVQNSELLPEWERGSNDVETSAGLPSDDVEFLDAYGRAKGFRSHSSVPRPAITMPRGAQLTSSYEAAWAEWQDTPGTSLDWARLACTRSPTRSPVNAERDGIRMIELEAGSTPKGTFIPATGHDKSLGADWIADPGQLEEWASLRIAAHRGPGRGYSPNRDKLGVRRIGSGQRRAKSRREGSPLPGHHPSSQRPLPTKCFT
jgi:hypothetical protein